MAEMWLNLKMWMCVVGAIGLQLLLPTQCQSVGPVEVLGEKQYLVGTTAKVSFHAALQVCAALNMTLASIESASEQTNLKNFLYANSLSRQYWLSGTDLPLSREFVWFGTGSLFSYTSWVTGVRTSSAQRCVRTDANFNWRRDSCNRQHYFICETPVLPYCPFGTDCVKRPEVFY